MVITHVPSTSPMIFQTQCHLKYLPVSQESRVYSLSSFFAVELCHTSIIRKCTNTFEIQIFYTNCIQFVCCYHNNLENEYQTIWENVRFNWVVNDNWRYNIFKSKLFYRLYPRRKHVANPVLRYCALKKWLFMECLLWVILPGPAC